MKILQDKGKIATIIGLVFAFPINIKFTIDYFMRAVEYTRGELTALCVFNAVAMVWFILPSRVIIKGPKIEITVED